MRYSLTLLFAFIFGVSLTAQQHDLHPCGTPSYKSEWLKKYQVNPTAYAGTRDDIMYVPIAVNIVADDNGNGGLSSIGLQIALCVLNEDFAQADMVFYLGRDVAYISDSRYAQHQTVEQGYEMMQLYDEPNMINCYFMADAAGNCGYNLPSAGMCVSNNCAGPGDHTWAHEMGHQLSLPHPFLGWEGGVSHDGSVGHDFNDPAPETVLYNYTSFKETFYTDTIIIDSALVEKVDGSNCQIAADGFCDTKPDYLSSRWACLDDNNSPTEQTDPNGEKFVSDGSLIMSYALDNCSSRFSDEQIAASRAFLVDRKGHVLGMEDPQEPVAATALTGQSPTDLQDVFPTDIELSWDAVPGATRYLVQLSIFESFQVPVYDAIVTDPMAIIPELQFPTREHWYRVKAFNDYNFCVEWLEGIGSFTPNELVNTTSLDQPAWLVRPTLISDQPYITIEAPDSRAPIQLQIIDTQGRLLISNTTRHEGTVDVSDLSTGIYIVQLSSGTQSLTTKIIVQ